MKDTHPVHQSRQKKTLFMCAFLLLLLSGAAYGLHQRFPELLVEVRSPSWQEAKAQNLATNAGRTWAVAFSPNGQTLASASENKTIQLWNVQTQQQLRILKGHQQDVLSVAFSPDGTTLASSSKDAAIKLWNLQTGELIRTLQGHRKPVRSVVFSPDGKTVISSS